MAKIGRPKEKVADKVDLEIVAMLVEKGLTDEELAKVFNKNPSTINDWKKDPEFFQVLKKGKDIADAKVVASLYKRACGYDIKRKMFIKGMGLMDVEQHYPPDTVACIFWLKNRQREDWKDRVEHGGPDGKPISVNIVSQKTGILDENNNS